MPAAPRRCGSGQQGLLCVGLVNAAGYLQVDAAHAGAVGEIYQLVDRPVTGGQQVGRVPYPQRIGRILAVALASLARSGVASATHR